MLDTLNRLTRIVRPKRIIVLSALAGAILLDPIAAQAQLEFTFAEPIQSVNAGSSVRFFANLTNTGEEQLFFNGFNPGLTAQGMTITDLFFTNVPDTFNPGDSGTYEIFGIVTDADASSGEYIGLADIDYDTATITGLHATQGYSLTVVPVVAPESSTAVEMSLGLASLGVLALERRKRMRAVSVRSGCRNR